MPSLSCPPPDRLRQLALADADAQAVREHLDSCADCARLAAGLSRGDSSQSAADVTLPPSDSDLTLAPVGSAAAAAGFGFLAPPQRQDELGRLGPYRVLKVLGKGGMGAVFLAEDVKLGRPLALKVMLPDQAERADARERFLREARAAASLEHDNVIAIFHVDEDHGVPYVAMPLLKGSSLEDWLTNERQNRPVEPARALQIAREIARGLAAAHEKGLVHRDVKPANVWLDATADGRVKILDFGLARVSRGEQHFTQTGAIMGTPAYVAPEQARGEQADGRADLFSLGVVLYRLCTGRLPFLGSDPISTLLALATEAPPPIQSLNPDVPAPLAGLVMRLLEKDPAKRIATARDVLRAIDDVEKALASPHKPPRRGRGVLVAAGFGALALVVAAAAAYVYWPAHSPAPQKATLRVTSSDPEVRVTLADGTEPTRTDRGSEFVVPAGEYVLTVRRGDVEIRTDKVAVAAGETVLLAVEARGGRLIVRRGGEVVGSAALPFVVELLSPPEAEPAPKGTDKDKGKEDHFEPERSPFDRYRREKLSAERLTAAGMGDANKAPRELVAVIGGPNVHAVLSADGRTVVLVQSLTSGQTVKLFDVVKGVETTLGSFPVNGPPVLSHDGKLLAVSHGSGDAGLWDVAAGKKVQTISKAHHRYVNVAFTPDDRALIVGSPDNHVGKGDPLTMVLVARRNKEKKAEPVKFEGGDVSPHWLALSPDGSVLAAAGVDPKKPGPSNAFVKLWNAKTGKLLGTLSENHRPVTALRFSPDGKLLARLTAFSSMVDLFDVATRKLAGKYEGHKGVVNALDVAFHPKGQRVASCDEFGNVLVWDVKTLTRSRAFRLPAPAGLSSHRVQWAPDGRHLLVRGQGPVYVLRLSKQRGPWVQLFDGRGLDGWQPIGQGRWSVEGGVLKADGKGVGWLATEKGFFDYELELEYRLPPKGNSGIFLRAWTEGAINGSEFLEIQLVDDPKVKPTQRTGALFGIAAPKPAPDAPPDRWHKVHVRSERPSVVVHFNGVRVLDVEVNRKETSGRIGLQCYNTPVEFRNVWLRGLNRPK
jgi:hypothetical protein